MKMSAPAPATAAAMPTPCTSASAANSARRPVSGDPALPVKRGDPPPSAHHLAINQGGQVTTTDRIGISPVDAGPQRAGEKRPSSPAEAPGATAAGDSPPRLPGTATPVAEITIRGRPSPAETVETLMPAFGNAAETSGPYSGREPTNPRQLGTARRIPMNVLIDDAQSHDSFTSDHELHFIGTTGAA